MFTNKVTTTKFWVSLPLFLVALLVTPSKGYCDDDVFGATPDGGLTFNDGSSTVGNDGLVEVKTNDPKCPKILWYPPARSVTPLLRAARTPFRVGLLNGS
jgi:hypothetical protein